MLSTPELVWKLEEDMGPLPAEGTGLTAGLSLGYRALSSAPHPCPSSSFLFPAQQETFVICYLFETGSHSVPQAWLSVSVSQGLRLQAGDSMPDLNLLWGGRGWNRIDGGQRRTPSSSFSLKTGSFSEPRARLGASTPRDLSVSALLFWVPFPHLGFHVGADGLNSGSHVCVANAPPAIKTLPFKMPTLEPHTQFGAGFPVSPICAEAVP